MSSIHYKLRSSLDYDTLTFDGPSISLSDLREAIMLQKKFGKTSDLTLEITNAQTKEVYQDPSVMIPRNTSVVVKRVPIARLAAVTGKSLDEENPEEQNPKVPLATLKQTGDLANANASEEDKISAMMQQSNEQWQSDQYVNKMRPREYICFRCGQKGHYIKDCPTIGDPRYNQQQRFRGGTAKEHYMMLMKERERQTTVVPSKSVAASRSYSPVVGSDVVGKKAVPVELQCPMCKKLLADAVVVPCCGTSYCDECIRNYLIDNEFACPSCKEHTVPDNLIANKSLRTAVSNFRNTSHLAVTNAEETTGKSPLHITTTPITIKLLKKEEPKPSKSENTSEENETAESKNKVEDTLNTSSGPITDAQLFEEIVKQPNKDSNDVQVADMKQDSSAQQDLAQKDAIKEMAENEQSGHSEAKPETSQSTALQANQLQQQTSLPQAQLSQQLNLKQQQQSVAMKSLQMQPQLQSAVSLQVQAPIMMQQVQQHVVSLPMVSNVNPVLPAQQIIVSGQQIIDHGLQTVVASQAYHSRLVTPGVVNQAIAAPVVVRQPTAGISVSAAYHPNAVNSAVPNRIIVGSHVPRPGHLAAREPGSFAYLDPLFDVKPTDKSLSLVPMTEEEFYRAKLRLKDGDTLYKKRSRSRSRSHSKQRTRQSRGYRSREQSSRKKSRHGSHDRHDSKRRSDKKVDRSYSKERKRHSRLGDDSRRIRREKSRANHQNNGSHDGAEKESSTVHPSRRKKRVDRSGSRSFSPNQHQNKANSRHQINKNESVNKSESSDAWSPSPPPQVAVNEVKKKRNRNETKPVDALSDIDSEEFKTVKLDESKSVTRKPRTLGARNTENGSDDKAKKRSRKRKSDDRQDARNVKMKKEEKNQIKKGTTSSDVSGSSIKKPIKAVKKLAAKKGKVKDQSGQESSLVSDESMKRDKILMRKTKKLKQKEKLAKAKKQRKMTNMTHEVEIKVARPLVDVSASYSESEVDAVYKHSENLALKSPEKETVETDPITRISSAYISDGDQSGIIDNTDTSVIMGPVLDHSSSINTSKMENNTELDNSAALVANSEVDKNVLPLENNVQVTERLAIAESKDENKETVCVSNVDKNAKDNVENDSLKLSIQESITEILNELIVEVDAIVNQREIQTHQEFSQPPTMKSASVETFINSSDCLSEIDINASTEITSSSICTNKEMEQPVQCGSSEALAHPKEEMCTEEIDSISEIKTSAKIIETENNADDGEQHSEAGGNGDEAEGNLETINDENDDEREESDDECLDSSDVENAEGDEESDEEQDAEESEAEDDSDGEIGKESEEENEEQSLSSEELVEENNVEGHYNEESEDEGLQGSSSEKDDSDEQESKDSVEDQDSNLENAEELDDSDEEQYTEEDSEAMNEQQPAKPKRKNQSILNEEHSSNQEHSEDESDDEKTKKKSRKEKKRKREKERKKRKRKHRYSEEEEENSGTEEESEPKKKKRKKSEKKSRKHKRKHRKHKKSKKHRKSRKNDDDDSSDEDLEKDTKKKNKLVKYVESDSEYQNENKGKLKAKKIYLKKRPAESDSDNENNLIVELNRPSSKEGKKSKPRTIYIERDLDDVRYIEAKKRTKTLREVTGKRK